MPIGANKGKLLTITDGAIGISPGKLSDNCSSPSRFLFNRHLSCYLSFNCIIVNPCQIKRFALKCLFLRKSNFSNKIIYKSIKICKMFNVLNFKIKFILLKFVKLNFNLYAYFISFVYCLVLIITLRQ